ncbi:uncharacterized protein ATNIH1004_000398 [Aspergillus tanneri]|uniref:Uncharacterized protein n=1 Tax=Aspergillus tanneri TaxID=1220188 RepID=A0A5M9N1K1_9EURO|nr:uncharacterized protein ATNIH1004_000398 [Aspergillus tanneri]KAA8651510.1 hypothetical protein ATNIH1004_000398 [Aspergillus tanneri]
MDENMIPLPIGYPASNDYLSRGWTQIQRTGYRGRLARDGLLYFEGRIGNDTIINLREIRVELEDVQSVILRQANGVLEQVLVSVRESRSKVVLEESALQLPVYATGSHHSPSIKSLSAHSKVDRRAIAQLPLPRNSQGTYDSQDQLLTHAQEGLRAVWDEVLPNELVDMADLTRRRFSVALPLADLYEANTLELMAEQIQTSNRNTSIGWSQETSVADLALTSIPMKLSEVKKSGIFIIMAGATGTLDSRLLAQLVDDARVSQIHCIAVRQQLDSPDELAKVSYHTDDLSQPYLGLSKSVFEQLLTSTSFCTLAAPRRAPIHYMSSGGLFFANPAVGMEDPPEQPHMSCVNSPPDDGTNGYVAYKWASKKILERAAEQFSLLMTVHRLMPIASMTMFQDKQEKALADLRAITQAQGIHNVSSDMRGHMDLMKADELATNMMATIFHTAGATRPSPPSAAEAAPRQHLPVSYGHHQSSVRLTVYDLEGVLEQSSGVEEGAKSISRPKRIGLVKAAGFSYIIASQDFRLVDITAEGGTDGTLCLGGDTTDVCRIYCRIYLRKI